jgi:hypothetical protein
MISNSGDELDYAYEKIRMNYECKDYNRLIIYFESL